MAELYPGTRRQHLVDPSDVVGGRTMTLGRAVDEMVYIRLYNMKEYM